MLKNMKCGIQLMRLLIVEMLMPYRIKLRVGLILSLVLLVSLLIISGSAQSAGWQRERSQVLGEIQDLQTRLQFLEKCMTGTYIDEDDALFMDALDPAPGNIKIVRGAVEVLDNCDVVTDWTVTSGADVTLAIDYTHVYEGNASILLYVPASTTAVITKNIGGAHNISTHKYFKMRFRNPYPATFAGAHMYFGESAYDEQDSGAFTIGMGDFTEYSWDISAIAVASRNGVNHIGFSVTTGSGGGAYFNFDYFFADPGPSQIKAHDGDRVILLYPKVYHGTYTSTGDDNLQIDIPRKGAPSYIEIQRDHATDARRIYWQTEFGAGNCLVSTASAAFQTNMIKSTGDCYFTLGTDADVNSGTPHNYYYTVMWED
jgi:hypothetical protein